MFSVKIRVKMSPYSRLNFLNGLVDERSNCGMFPIKGKGNGPGGIDLLFTYVVTKNQTNQAINKVATISTIIIDKSKISKLGS
jgi:hypothetical protein